MANKKSVATTKSFWQVGKSYFVRTVTMHNVGKLKVIEDNELIFEKCSWIADSGIFHNALKDGTLSEVEPFVDDVLINRQSIIDATFWDHELPTEQR